MSVPQLYSLARIYFILINAVAFVAFGWDKYCAKKGHRRISEATLLLLAAIGGSEGAIAAMVIFNHKTRKLKFNLTVPLLLILQLGLVFILTMGL